MKASLVAATSLHGAELATGAALRTRANALSITLRATVVALGATSRVTRQEDSTTLRVTWLQVGVVALLAGSSVRATVVATLYGARRSGGADPVVTQPKI